MKITVLIVGNELNIQQLISDVCGITFGDSEIIRRTDIDGLYKELDDNRNNYNLILLNCRQGKKVYEELIPSLRDRYKDVISRIIIIFDSMEEKPDDSVLHDIPNIVKPFSLDKFGEMIQKICEK
jgi:hypothetical protein